MANKNTNMILAVAVIAVCAIAIIGVGYAYTATTDNTGNTSTVKYITLSQNSPGYVGNFNTAVTYDTVTTSTETTYKLHTTNTITGVGGVVKLGSVAITVTNSEGNADAYKFSVTNSTGMTATSTGKFYIGYVIGTNAEVVKEYTINTHHEAGSETKNYYSATGAAAVTSLNDATAISATAITVNLYYSDSATDLESAHKPLNNVTFTFEAEAPFTA